MKRSYILFFILPLFSIWLPLAIILAAGLIFSKPADTQEAPYFDQCQDGILHILAAAPSYGYLRCKGLIYGLSFDQSLGVGEEAFCNIKVIKSGKVEQELVCTGTEGAEIYLTFITGTEHLGTETAHGTARYQDGQSRPFTLHITIMPDHRSGD